MHQQLIAQGGHNEIVSVLDHGEQVLCVAAARTVGVIAMDKNLAPKLTAIGFVYQLRSNHEYYLLQSS